MEKMDSLRAGVAEMRSVAQRLNQWADDLEASFRDPEANEVEVGEAPTTASGGNFVGAEVNRNKRAPQCGVAPIEVADAGEPAPAHRKKKAAADKAAAEPAAAEEKGKALTLPEVRSVLAGKCAAGFSTQVKALIESYGAASLKEVPAEKYEELLEAVKGWGEPLSTASGGNLERGEVNRNK